MSRDFHAWLEATGKNLEELYASLPTLSEAGSSRRAAVRKHAYPPIYGRGQYPDADNITHAGDANFYIHQKGQ